MLSTIYKTSKSRTVGHLVNEKIAIHINSLSSQHNSRRKQRMAIFANDYIGIQINQFGFYELDALEILFDFLTPLQDTLKKGTALDIGANIGNHSIFFSNLFRTVHSFEPSPSTFELLKFNASCVDNVEVHGIGLGDKEGVFKLVENPTNLGGSSIKYGDTLKNRNIDIRVKRLDDLALDLSLLCFVKIDVEGFESNVLRGGIQTIKKSKPIIAFEQFESEFLDGTTESISLLSDIGYRFCWYRAGTLSKLWVIRRFYNIKELAMGRTHRMVTGQNVPKDTYSMLIAVPPQYHGILGLA